MEYAIKFRSSARTEVDWLEETYDGEFAEELHAWLNGLADDAQNRNWSTSLDATQLVGDLLGGPSQQETTLQRNLRRLQSATGIERLRALLVVVMKRCPPWQFRTASRWFVILDSIPVEIEVFYEADHVDRRIIYTSVQIVNDGAGGDE